jgi:hypothetical protein
MRLIWVIFIEMGEFELFLSFNRAADRSRQLISFEIYMKPLTMRGFKKMLSKALGNL